MNSDKTKSAQDQLASALSISPNHKELEGLAKKASITTCPAGTRLFGTGDRCENFVVILQGIAKMRLSTHTGREMILFRLRPGETCALTTSCILTDSPYYAEGVAETELEILTLPSQLFLDSLRTRPELFIKLLNSYAQRIGELTSVIDRLMTRDLNHELKTLLLKKANAKKQVILSHQMMADELGSSREVISRKLKTLEKTGLVKMSRGQVTLTGLE